MKLTIIGGGGVRTPLLVKSILRRSSKLDINELCLMDINEEKLTIIGLLIQEIIHQAKSSMKITTTINPEIAFSGADYIITTIRVGDDNGRILDERIALRHGVLGQETTGPGGFAMALRAIPVLLNYAKMIEKICPDAWVFNFSNPAGLVTQALRDSGFNKIVGICDGANLGQNNVAAWYGINPSELLSEVYGLNHLSWTRAVYQGKRNLLPELLENDAFLAKTNQNLFSPELVRQIGMFLNEYLFYFYYREDALKHILSKDKTRGELVAEINTSLFSELKRIDPYDNSAEALIAYYKFNDQRVGSYMDFSRFSGSYTDSSLHLSEADKEKNREMEEEGYAGIALNLIQAFETGIPLHTALNVPNQDSISGMNPDDIVEVSCCVDQSGITPMPIGNIPESHLNLMKSIKLYEKTTFKAILTKSRELAIEALMYHPLVLSYPLACNLVNDYLQAHKTFTGLWE